MKSQMRMEFEARHGFEVCDDMDIQTSVAWDNWKEAWKAAIDHARYKANECADNNAYTPAQKRALGAWLQRVALTVEDETPNRHETALREGPAADPRDDFKINNNAAPDMARLYGLVTGDNDLFQLRGR